MLLMKKGAPSERITGKENEAGEVEVYTEGFGTNECATLLANEAPTEQRGEKCRRWDW